MIEKIIGSEIKVRVRVTNIDGGNKMSGVAFNCKFYTTQYSADPSRKVVLQKSQMLQIDDDTYVALVDSALVGTGILICEITMYVPDYETTDGVRTEILRATTDVKIVE